MTGIMSKYLEMTNWKKSFSWVLPPAYLRQATCFRAKTPRGLKGEPLDKTKEENTMNDITIGDVRE